MNNFGMLFLRKMRRYYKKLQSLVFTYILPKGTSRYLLYKKVREKLFKMLLFRRMRKNGYCIRHLRGRYSFHSLKKNVKPVVSIIIPVHNKFDYTYLCILSIIENTTETDYEIIIADDVSTDETVDIKKYFRNIVVSRNSENLGFLKNCNRASKLAKGEYILFLNNDTQVQKNWLGSLVRSISQDDEIGMIGSKLIYPDGKLQEAGSIVWDDASAWNYGKGDYSYMPEYNYVREVDYISGAAIMIRKKLWRKIGGFDELFVPAYCEDSDLAFEVRRMGYKVIYQPKSVVVHFEGISHGTDVSSGIKKYQIDNLAKFHKKWKSELKRNHFPNGKNVFQARDRSSGKKTILIVDHYVPTYDKDAGSRTVYQYVLQFVELGFNVKFIGDNYIPYEPYTSELEELGVEVLYGLYMERNWKEWIRENSAYLDYVLLNRPHIAEKYLAYIKKNTRAKVFYYGHDLHFLREHRRYEIEKEKSALISSESWKKREYAIIEKSDVVLYPSKVEIDILQKDFPNKPMYAITPYVFKTCANIPYNTAKRKGIMFVGGFSHQPNIDAVEWFFESVKPLIDKAGYRDPIYIVGSNPTLEVKKYSSDRVFVTGYVTDEQLANYYSKTRIVVVPLRYGAGIKGKIIEAMAFGVPVFTTSVGAEGLTDVFKTVAIGDDAKSLANIIIEKYSDSQGLKRMSGMGLKYISKFFSPEAVGKQIKGWIS